MSHVLRRLITVLCVLFAPVTLADAAAVPSGATLTVYAALVRGNAVGYDSVNSVYLVVGAQGAGNVRGRFVAKNGVAIGADFVIQASGNYTHFPRVAFSPDADSGAGGFLVTWHESDMAGGNTSIHGRIVSFTKSGPAGADTLLAADGSWWEAGPAVAYASGSKEFLVAWRRLVGNDIRAVRVGLSGAILAPAFNVTASADYEDNPSIAYNPTTNQFLVAYGGYNDPGKFAFLDTRLIQAGSGQMIGAAASRLFAGAATFITDTTYIASTNQFLVAWYNGSASLGRLVAADGMGVGNIIALSSRWKAPDALSVAYNALTDTTMLVSHAGACSSNCADDGGVEITNAGLPVDNGFQITSAGGSGNFYPRIAASTGDPNWLLSTAHNFGSTMSQLLVGTAVAPPPPKPNPVMSIDAPGAGVVQQPFLFSGWAADLGSTKDPGVDAVHVWAVPTKGGAAIFAGVATLGGARPDVASVFGSQFANSGYGLVVAGMPGGSYTLVAYMHSSVSGTFNLSKTVSVTISAPTIAIDTPQAGPVTQAIWLSGWTADLGSPTGDGVDAVHVWALPTGGGPAIFAGSTTPNRPRPDVANVFGSQFANSGYGLFLNTLPTGSYTLVVYAHSTVTGTFSAWQTVQVTTSNAPVIAIDAPTAGIATQPVWFSGWAADFAAATGTGADAVHVWAYPSDGSAAIFAGVATPNQPRPDVGSVFGSQFTNSGYGLILNPLPRGTYTLVAYMHSTVTGTFSASQSVQITISTPVMAIDTPVGGVAAGPIWFSGWAVDLGATTGTGADAVHVWATPSGGGSPIFVGAATPNIPRPDIAAAFGSQFTNSGYGLFLSALPSGTYTLTASIHSTVTGTFNASKSVQVIVP